MHAAGRAIDILVGFVREVLDGRTLDLNLVSASPEQRMRYHGSELVRLVGASAVPAEATDEMRLRLHHRRVRCFVHGRDADGRLLAVVIPVAESAV